MVKEAEENFIRIQTNGCFFETTKESRILTQRRYVKELGSFWKQTVFTKLCSAYKYCVNKLGEEWKSYVPHIAVLRRVTYGKCGWYRTTFFGE